MDNFSSNLLLKKRLNVLFLIFLSAISFATLITTIWLLFANSPDTFNLKRPAPYLLLPIYLVVRIVFLKIELGKNINIDKTEEVVKFSLLIYFLTIISMKFFPLNSGNFWVNLLAINTISFNSAFSIVSIIKTFIANLILFIPLGFLVPMIMNKFRNIRNCIILSLIIAVSIYILQIVLHTIGLYVVNIISLDLLFMNIIGALIGHKFYHSSTLSKNCTN